MAIFDLHYPGVFTFGILGNIISIFVYFAPLPTFIRIYKEKSTLGFQSLPYVVALFSAMLWMYYAFLKTDSLLLISINSFGCIIESIYIFVFLLYASKTARKDTWKLLSVMNVGLFAMIFVATYFLFQGSIRVQVVGWICVGVSVIVFAAPLSIVFEVVRTKSVEFMPFSLSFFLTLSAIMWFGYGLLQKDLCIALPNVLGFFLGMIQMILYGMYKNDHPEAKQKQIVLEEKKMVENDHVHVINIAATHPIDDLCKKEDETVIVSVDQQTVNVDDEEEEEYSLSNKVSNVEIDTPAMLVMCAA